MKRFLVALLLALCATVVHAEEVVPVTVGGTEISLGIPDGYLLLSKDAPSLFATSQAALPPSIRLVEALMTRQDLKRVVTGEAGTAPYVQVQAMRDAEVLDFSAEDWAALQPALAQQLGATDLGVATQAMQEGMGERMGKASGSKVQIQYGEVGKAQVYSQQGGVIRYSIRLPMNANVNGIEVQEVLDCAGAALVIRGKLVMLNVYQREDPARKSAERVREFLAMMVERAQALNAHE